MQQEGQEGKGGEGKGGDELDGGAGGYILPCLDQAVLGMILDDLMPTTLHREKDQNDADLRKQQLQAQRMKQAHHIFAASRPLSVIGMRVRVQWNNPGNRGTSYYGAVVEEYNPRNSKHRLFYDDGELHYHVLGSKIFYIEEEGHTYDRVGRNFHTQATDHDALVAHVMGHFDNDTYRYREGKVKQILKRFRDNTDGLLAYFNEKYQTNIVLEMPMGAAAALDVRADLRGGEDSPWNEWRQQLQAVSGHVEALLSLSEAGPSSRVSRDWERLHLARILVEEIVQPEADAVAKMEEPAADRGWGLGAFGFGGGGKNKKRPQGADLRELDPVMAECSPWEGRYLRRLITSITKALTNSAADREVVLPFLGQFLRRYVTEIVFPQVAGIGNEDGGRVVETALLDDLVQIVFGKFVRDHWCHLSLRKALLHCLLTGAGPQALEHIQASINRLGMAVLPLVMQGGAREVEDVETLQLYLEHEEDFTMVPREESGESDQHGLTFEEIKLLRGGATIALQPPGQVTGYLQSVAKGRSVLRRYTKALMSWLEDPHGTLETQVAKGAIPVRIATLEHLRNVGQVAAALLGRQFGADGLQIARTYALRTLVSEGGNQMLSLLVRQGRLEAPWLPLKAFDLANSAPALDFDPFLWLPKTDRYVDIRLGVAAALVSGKTGGMGNAFDPTQDAPALLAAVFTQVLVPRFERALRGQIGGGEEKGEDGPMLQRGGGAPGGVGDGDGGGEEKVPELPDGRERGAKALDKWFENGVRKNHRLNQDHLAFMNVLKAVNQISPLHAGLGGGAPSLFRASSQSSMAQLLQAQVAVHVIGSAALSPGSFLYALLCDPLAQAKSYVPTMPDDITATIMGAVGSVTKWWKCPNGHLYAVGNCGQLNQSGKCPSCGAQIGGQNKHGSVTPQGNAQAGQVGNETKPGYLPDATTGTMCEVTERPELSPTGIRVLRLFMHMVLSASASLEVLPGTGAAVAELVSGGDGGGGGGGEGKGGEPSVTRALGMLHGRLLEDWVALKKHTDLPDAQLAVALHLVLRNYSEVVANRAQPTELSGPAVMDTALRTRFEKQFQQRCVNPVFGEGGAADIVKVALVRLKEREQDAAAVFLIDGFGPDLWNEMHEDDARPSLDSLLWRVRRPLSVAHFSRLFGASVDNVARYPVLDVFLREEHRLPIVRYAEELTLYDIQCTYDTGRRRLIFTLRNEHLYCPDL